MRSALFLSLLPLALAGHDAKDAMCKSPWEPFSTYCCHGALIGPSVTAGNHSTLASSVSAAASSLASDASSVLSGLSGVITNGLPTGVTAHVPVPIHTGTGHPEERGIPSAVASKASDKHETSLAPGVTCKGTVETMSAKSNGTAAATTSGAMTGGSSQTGMGIGVSSSVTGAPSASSAASASASSGIAARNDGLWALGAGVGVGIGMVLL